MPQTPVAERLRIVEGKHCVNCRHCVRIFTPSNGESLGGIDVTNESAPVRCRFGFWGEKYNGTEKTYSNVGRAMQSLVLRSQAERCPEYDEEL